MDKPDSRNRTLVFDAEANGFLDQVTKIWCFYFIDVDTLEGFLFHDFDGYCGATGVDEEGTPFTIPKKAGSLRDGALFAHRAKGLICHNCLGYDFALIKKFYPKFKIRYNYPAIRDTLLESQVQWFDRPPVKGYKGIHGLAVYGARLGIRKPEIEDWTTFDIHKLNRCIEDVKINLRVAQYLEYERKQIKEQCGIDFTQALTIEHEYRYNCTNQELYGAKVDKEHMEECVVDLTKKVEEYRQIIEPQLPPTVKLRSPKVDKITAFKAVGLRTDHIDPEELKYMKQHAGEMKEFIRKDWLKPTTKWTNLKEVKHYSIVDAEGKELIPHQFPKLKEARDYANEHFRKSPKDKFKYPSKVVTEEVFSANTKSFFGEKLFNMEIVGAFSKIEVIDSKMSQDEKLKLYLLDLGWQTTEWTVKTGVKLYAITDVEGKELMPFSFNTLKKAERYANKHFRKSPKDKFKYPSKIDKNRAARADERGTAKWPKVPYKGKQLKLEYRKGEKVPVTPQVSKDSLPTLPDGVGEDIKKFNAYVHRLNFIANPKDYSKGLLNNIRPDGRVTCGITGFGTTAGRATQYNWVNAPGLKALYGEEIRKIIVADEGKALMGIDMPSAHPRLLADFTQNELFIKAVDGNEEDPETGEYLGEDFHTVNSILFKLNTQEEVDEARRTQDHDLILNLGKARGSGKGFSYAVLYGGSDQKLSQMMNNSLEEASSLKENFLAGLGLDLLLEEVDRTWEDRKWNGGSYIEVLGGYHIWCLSKHTIINYKALGSEAVVQKVAVNWLNRELKRAKIDAHIIINYHDEVLVEFNKGEEDIVKNVVSEMYKAAALELGLTLDWSSSCKIGHDYSKCH